MRESVTARVRLLTALQHAERALLGRTMRQWSKHASTQRPCGVDQLPPVDTSAAWNGPRTADQLDEAPATNSLRNRLLALDSLHREGVITKQELADARSEAIFSFAGNDTPLLKVASGGRR